VSNYLQSTESDTTNKNVENSLVLQNPFI